MVLAPRFAAIASLKTGLRDAWRLWRHPSTPWLARLIPVAALVYVVMPFDLAPDLVPMLGWIDDAMLVPIALAAFERVARGRFAQP